MTCYNVLILFNVMTALATLCLAHSNGPAHLISLVFGICWQSRGMAASQVYW